MQPKLLSIKVSQTEPSDPLKILVSITSPFEAEAPSLLPYGEAVAMPAVLKALEAVNFNRNDYEDEELAWLQREQLVTGASGSLAYSSTMRESIGKRLFECVFPTEQMRSIYDQARRESNRQEIHFQICFDARAPLVGACPWELLHHNEDFLLVGGRGTLTRYISFDSPPAFRELPSALSVLLVAPRPPDPMLPRLDNSETRAIRCAIDEAHAHFSLHPQEVSSFPDLEDYLSRHCGDDSPDIIHFDGHGAFGRRCMKCRTVTTKRSVDRCTNCSHPLEGLKPQGYLVFEDAQGRTDYRSADEFSDLVRQALVSVNHEARGGIRLIVLSACRSGVARGTEQVFNGVSQRLVEAGVPSVVAMQFSIRTDVAERFARRLYQQIAAGVPLVTAMSWGRTTLGDDTGDQWYRPVLYLRWRDNEGGQLFSLPEQSPDDPSDGPLPETVNPLFINPEDVESLAILLTKSGRVQTGNARRALCIEIQVDPNALEFIEGGAPRAFALQLVQYLIDTDDRPAALRLCNALRRDLRGRYVVDLERLCIEIAESA